MFRQVLLQGIEDEIFFGKDFNHYTLDHNQVTANFTDGSSVSGSLLVGADGLRSKVRKQLLPQLKIVDTGTRIIYGKTPLTDSFLSGFPKDGHQGMSLVTDASLDSPKTLLFETIRFPYADKIAEPKLPDPYVYWVLLANKKAFGLPDDKLLRLDHQESADMSVKLTENWNPALQSLFKAQDIEQASTLRIVSVREIPSWDSQVRVTLLGDAIHVMPPTGALGANTALRDAGDLARRIVEAGGIGKLDINVIKEYEYELRAAGNEAVSYSWQGGRRSFGLGRIEDCDVIDI
jgi:2-polyprenyl-6-methoxyphenol hydroxylase-like FAD-dependent oxidoreductase